MSALWEMLGLRTVVGPDRSAASLRFTVLGEEGSEGNVAVQFALPHDARDSIITLSQLLGVLKQLDVVLPPLDSEMRARVSIPGGKVDALIAAGTTFAWTCSDCRR